MIFRNSNQSTTGKYKFGIFQPYFMLRGGWEGHHPKLTEIGKMAIKVFFFAIKVTVMVPYLVIYYYYHGTLSNFDQNSQIQISSLYL